MRDIRYPLFAKVFLKKEFSKSLILLHIDAILLSFDRNAQDNSEI
jgi:hypothetical protein